MPQVVDAAHLLALLSREIELARQLLNALEQEHDALEQHSASAIQAALELKTERLAQFERSETERRRALSSLDIADNRGAIDAYFADQAKEMPALAQLWTELLDLAEACRRQNQSNGALVDTQRRHVQRALDILRGEPDATTYGPDGDTDRRSGSHSLAKA